MLEAIYLLLLSSVLGRFGEGIGGAGNSEGFELVDFIGFAFLGMALASFIGSVVVAYPNLADILLD